LGRVANGVPDRTHRLKALGNAVVPQIPYYIAKTILEVMDA
jgi:site-specific DNA-cytosine methylase